MSANEVAEAAREVVKYWRDWPQSKRDSVAALSQFLAAALDDLAAAVESGPRRGECATCGRVMNLTKGGTLRHHNGDFYIGGWRQVCFGAGEPPLGHATQT